MAPRDARLATETIDPDEGEVTAAFVAFLEAASRRRHPTGPIRRFNQGRASGCVHAEFIVPADLPEAVRVGLFAAPGTYRAVIRFANAVSSTDRGRDVRGYRARPTSARTSPMPAAPTDDYLAHALAAHLRDGRRSTSSCSSRSTPHARSAA
jgi:hypothetical protein